MLAATVACLAAVVLAVDARDAFAESRPAELVGDACIKQRLNLFAEEARAQEATLRVEVKILDDECAQTVQMVLWETPEGRARATAMVADHLSGAQQIEQARSEQPALSEASPCDALPLVTMKVTREGEARLPELIGRLRALRIPPVLEPLLILHGLQYEVRIESGISESTFSFHAPGHPRPSQESLHPLDRWSQELRQILGIECISRQEEEMEDARRELEEQVRREREDLPTREDMLPGGKVRELAREEMAEAVQLCRAAPRRLVEAEVELDTEGQVDAIELQTGSGAQGCDQAVIRVLRASRWASCQALTEPAPCRVSYALTLGSPIH